MEKVAKKLNIPKVNKEQFEEVFNAIASIKLSRDEAGRRNDLIEISEDVPN